MTLSYMLPARFRIRSLFIIAVSIFAAVLIDKYRIGTSSTTRIIIGEPTAMEPPPMGQLVDASIDEELDCPPPVYAAQCQCKNGPTFIFEEIRMDFAPSDAKFDCEPVIDWDATHNKNIEFEELLPMEPDLDERCDGAAEDDQNVIVRYSIFISASVTLKQASYLLTAQDL